MKSSATVTPAKEDEEPEESTSGNNDLLVSAKTVTHVEEYDEESTSGNNDLLVSAKTVSPAEEDEEFLLSATSKTKSKREEGSALAEKLYAQRCRTSTKNLEVVDKFIDDDAEFFNPVMKLCPVFNILMSYVMVNSFGVYVKSVPRTLELVEWGEAEAERSGSSLATFIRKRKTGDVALDAWRLNYAQLKMLFDEVEGFEVSEVVENTHT